MTRQNKHNNVEDYKNVMNAVRDYIFEKHRLPQVNDILRLTGIQKIRGNEVVDQLVKQKQLYVAFDGAGLAKIILLYDMMQGILMTQKKPDWLETHSFSEKNANLQKIEALQKDIIKYEQFERLLYATDIPLEDAVAFALDWLGFENVIHHKDDKNNPDVTFEFEGLKALLEAEGTSKQGQKDKILQLGGWIQKEIENGTLASKLKGFFAVNHFRDLEPTQRGDALTAHAKEFLKIYNYTYFTTRTLYDIVKQVSDGKITKEEARKQIWNGEKINDIQ